MSTTLATQKQQNQASATPELMGFLLKLTTPQPSTPVPRPQTINSATSSSVPHLAAPVEGTWQDRWINDHLIDAVVDRLGPSTLSPPLASLVFHPRVPAVRMLLSDGRWSLPPPTATKPEQKEVSVNSHVYQASVATSPVIPHDVSHTSEAWVSFIAKNAWGYSIAESALTLLEAMKESPIIPAWQTRYAVVPRNQLAKRVVLGPFTGHYEDWKLAEAAAKDMQEESYVLEIVEDVETGDADVLDFMGTNMPSTRRPMMRAGLIPK